MKCTIQTCNHTADSTFALVPVCEFHRFAILEEAGRFYRGTSNMIESERRPLYYQIRHLVPWRKKVGEEHALCGD